MKRWPRKLLLLILAPGLLALLVFSLFRLRYAGELAALGEARVRSAALNLIHEAVGEQIRQGNLDYNRIIYFEKDTTGRITALRTNMQQVNRLKAETLRAIDRELPGLESAQLEIPLGTLVFPELLAGKGPAVPVHILTVRSSSASFLSHFTQAGINQTLHQLHMVVKVEGTLLVLGSIRTYSVTGDVLAAETVIVGQVPDSFS